MAELERRRFLSLVFGVSTLVGLGAAGALTGCGGGHGTLALPNSGNNGGNGGGGGTPTRSPLMGDVSGYVVRSGGGEGALQVSFSAPGAGSNAAGGARAEVVGVAGATAVVGANGAFQIKNVPAGLRVLRLTPASGSTAAPLEIPLTVIPNTIIQVGEPLVSRTQALAVAQSALAAMGSDALICAPQQPLSAGVALRSGEETGAGMEREFVTTSPQWLVYADLVPTAHFGHPTRFCLVDAFTGSVTTVLERQFWPVLNGGHYYIDAYRGADTADVVQEGSAAIRRSTGAAPLTARVAHRSSSGAAKTRARREGKTLSLVVKGSVREDFKQDVANIPALFGSGGLPGSTPTVLIPPSADKKDVLEAWETLCTQATVDDVVFFFLSTHGSNKGYALLYTDLTPPPGTPEEEILTLDSGTEYLIEHLFPDELLPALSKCLACEIVVMIESCYAGFWSSAFTRASSNGALATLCPGATLTVLTATDEGHVAYGKVEGAGSGSMYVNEFLTAYNQLAAGMSSGGEVSLFQAHSRASAAMGSLPEQGMRDQNPQIFQSTPAGGVSDACGIVLSPGTRTVSPREHAAKDFEVQVCGKRPAGGAYTYVFTCTNRAGTLVSTTDANTAGNATITSPHPVIGYLTKLNASDGQTDEITVEVHTVEDTPRKVGTAKAQITIQEVKDRTITPSFHYEDFPAAKLQAVGLSAPPNGGVVFTCITFPLDADSGYYLIRTGSAGSQTGYKITVADILRATSIDENTPPASGMPAINYTIPEPVPGVIYDRGIFPFYRRGNTILFSRGSGLSYPFYITISRPPVIDGAGAAAYLAELTPDPTQYVEVIWKSE